MTCSRGSFDKIGFPFSRQAGSISQGVHSMFRSMCSVRTVVVFVLALGVTLGGVVHEARGQVKTEIVIGNVGQAAGPILTIPVDLSLDDEEFDKKKKVFLGFSVLLKENKIFPKYVAVTIPPYTGPKPGQKVTVTCTSDTVTKGQEYLIDAKMMYYDPQSNVNTSTSAKQAKYTPK
jgi:hypothetical protein